MIRNWRPYTLGALCHSTGCTPLEPCLHTYQQKAQLISLDSNIFDLKIFLKALELDLFCTGCSWKINYLISTSKTPIEGFSGEPWI
jgi:hypothetical protein